MRERELLFIALTAVEDDHSTINRCLDDYRDEILDEVVDAFMLANFTNAQLYKVINKLKQEKQK